MMKMVFLALCLSVVISGNLIAQDRDGLSVSDIQATLLELQSGSLDRAQLLDSLHERIAAAEQPDTLEFHCETARDVYDFWEHSRKMKIALTITSVTMAEYHLAQLRIQDSINSRPVDPAEIEQAEEKVRIEREKAAALEDDLNQSRADKRAEVNQICHNVATVDTLDIAYYRLGRFSKTGPNRWSEVNSHGHFSFEQIGQDAWSLYLKDLNRNEIYIQIDLWRNMICLRSGSQPWRDLYPIEAVSSTMDFID